jgi:parvulin-like peptidyl-prolyl isomerase
VSKIGRSTAALGAALCVGAVVSACGGVPGNAVVSVGGTPITKTAFNHWMAVAAAGAAAAQKGKKASKPPVPEPPSYTACIAYLEATAPKPKKGKVKPTAAQYKSQCEQEYSAYKQEVLSFLISSQWVLSEASEQGVHVSQAEVKKQFDTLKGQQFPKESAFKEFLERTGETESDLMARVKLQLLARKIQEKVTKEAKKKKPSKAEIAKYYDEHKQQFGKPASRNVQLILTKTEGAAKSAKSEIEGGKSFASVAKSVSIDPLTKKNGGTLNEVTPGEEEKALSTAIFAAKTGKLEGPVKTPFGYYVFEVTKTNAPSQQTLAQAESAISQQLTSQSQQKALSSFVKEFRTKWTSKTECRAGYVVPDCKEYKKPKTSTTKTSSTG